MKARKVAAMAVRSREQMMRDGSNEKRAGQSGGKYLRGWTPD